MSRDNVTPFRRPPRRKPPSQGLGLSTHRGKAVLVHVLTLASFPLSFIGASSWIGLLGTAMAIGAGVMAFSNRGETMPWASTHHEHAFRTLMIGFVLWTLLSLPMFVLSRDLAATSVGATIAMVVFWARVAVLLWVLVRAGIALVLAVIRKPIPHPRGWLI